MPNQLPVCTLFLFVLIGVLNSSGIAQTVRKRELAASAVTSPLNLPGPESRTRPKTTRGLCYLVYDNYTGYFIDIWIEGIYQGRVAPYAQLYRLEVWVPGKWTEIYMQTSDGKLYWKATGYCNDSRVLALKNGKIASSKPNLKD